MNKRQQLLGLIAIAALALLAGDQLLLSPLSKAWKERATRLADLRQKVNQGTLLLDREDTIRARWNSYQSNSLPADVSAAENLLLSSFDRWSKESRIGITSIKPQWRRQDDAYNTLECRIDAFGSLSALARFLYEIERSPLGLKVDTVDINRRDDRGERLTLALQVSGLHLINPPATTP